MTPGGGPKPGAAQPGVPDVAEGQVFPGGQRPIPVNGLPAGAVLVAVQSTAVSARTDEAGRFTLSGVPAGQYMTVAAGPVAESISASAERPNVFVSGGQSVDIGTLSLGGGASGYGFPCRYPLGSGAATPEEMAPGEATPAGP
jgi:hypothetical protein